MISKVLNQSFDVHERKYILTSMDIRSFNWTCKRFYDIIKRDKCAYLFDEVI